VANAAADSSGLAVARDQAGIDLARDEIGMTERFHQERGVGPDRPHRAAGKHFSQPFARLVAVGAMGDDLGDHRVVERRDFAALLDAGVDAPAFRPAEAEQFELADRGQEAPGRVFGIEPRFDPQPLR
jgi:hypothetical protein